MANIIDDIRRGVFSKLTGTSSSFRSAISTGSDYRLYYRKAPQGKPLPYVVFTILPITETRDSTTKFARFQLQFSIATTEAQETTCQSIAGYLKDLFDDCEASLSIGSYLNIDVSYQSTVVIGELDGVMNIAVTYSITLQH